MAEKKTRSTTEKKTTTVKKTASRPAAKDTTVKKSRRTVTKQETPASVPVVEFAPAPAPRRRPLFQAGTWISILTLAALVALTFYLKGEKQKTGAEDATPTLETAFIFTEADGIVSSIEVKPAEGEAAKIARNAENAWAIVLPREAEANQGLAEAAATQLTALPITAEIEAGKSPDIFGLDKPAYVITIEFKNGKTRTLEVGDTTPTNSGYYVRLDKDKMLVTDLSGIDALLNLRSSPPYLNTPVPTTLPTAEAVVTPTP